MGALLSLSEMHTVDESGVLTLASVAVFLGMYSRLFFLVSSGGVVFTTLDSFF